MFRRNRCTICDYIREIPRKKKKKKKKIDYIHSRSLQSKKKNLNLQEIYYLASK